MGEPRRIGRYEVLERIGKGGMATVYRARQQDLDRIVALKELDHIGGPDRKMFASRFLREARMASSLSHPNIVTVFDYIEHDGRPYIAMEYVPGGSLRDCIDGLTLAQTAMVLEGLLSALAHAEHIGIVHRDLKPENILVTRDGRVQIADFGIAKAYDSALSPSVTLSGTIVGTPRYMAPEQGTGKLPSRAADLYAVGVIAFEMFAGRVPFDSDQGPISIIWQHVNDPVPDLRVIRPDLDPRMADWVERLLAKHPADRPVSAAAALEQLEEVVLDVLGGRWRRHGRLGVGSNEEGGTSLEGETSGQAHEPIPTIAPESRGGPTKEFRRAWRDDVPADLAPRRMRQLRTFKVTLTSVRLTVGVLAVVAAAILLIRHAPALQVPKSPEVSVDALLTVALSAIAVAGAAAVTLGLWRRRRSVLEALRARIHLASRPFGRQRAAELPSRPTMLETVAPPIPHRGRDGRDWRDSAVRQDLEPTEIAITRFTYDLEPWKPGTPIPLLGDGTLRDELSSRLRNSQGGLFMITGFKGVGKTTLVERASHTAQQHQRSKSDVRLVVRIPVPRPLPTADLLFKVLIGIYRRLRDWR